MAVSDFFYHGKCESIPLPLELVMTVIICSIINHIVIIRLKLEKSQDCPKKALRLCKKSLVCNH